MSNIAGLSVSSDVAALSVSSDVAALSVSSDEVYGLMSGLSSCINDG